MALPTNINHLPYLLSVNRHKGGEIKNAVPGVHVTPLFLDPESGTWVLYERYEPNFRAPLHFHAGSAHFYTTSGSWSYLEYPDEVQTAGSYLYEPAGSVHTFVAGPEGAEGFMVVVGPNINFDENGNLIDILDAGLIEQTLIQVAKETGQELPRYIRKTGAEFSK